MPDSKPTPSLNLTWTTLRQAGVTFGYVVLGMLLTVATALAALYLTQPMQSVVYDLFYLRVGPSEATETAILVHFLTAGLAGLGVSLTVGDFLGDGTSNRAPLGKAVAGLAALVVVFLALAAVGLAAFLTAILVLSLGFVGVPLALRYRYGVESGGVPAFLGGVPVVVLLLLLAGFGIGWGWGYVMTAREMPDAAVDGTVTDFEDAPEVRADLFDADNCETTSDGRRECLLSLRGYEHERRAARFMAQHGVQCPYQNSPSPGRSESFLAQVDGTYYRISCSPHGD